ncbi:MAG: PqiC family protein [Luteolibacter sp.]|uniref:PqiC family protein n=1 Tax=Luteolibacter sp. TaxID=1962973 RepID=UPI003264328D
MKMLFILPILLSLTNCGVLEPVKDSAVHHVLDPLVPYRSLSSSSPSIAINRPSIPSYLDRQQLVTRSGGQLQISNADLWGEPLDASLSRVTASNLSRLTGSMNIQPVENFTTLDYTTLLEMRIARFEPDDSNQMILEGTWKLQPVSGGDARDHFFSIAAPISSPTATGRVNAMNQALERIARQIANSL